MNAMKFMAPLRSLDLNWQMLPVHARGDRDDKARRYFSDKGMLPTVMQGGGEGVRSRGVAICACAHGHDERIVCTWRDDAGRRPHVFETPDGR